MKLFMFASGVPDLIWSDAGWWVGSEELEGFL